MIIPDNTEQNEKLNGIRNYHLPCLNEFFIIQIIRTQRERVHHHHHFGYKFPIEIFLAAWFRVQQSSNDSLWIWFFKCNSNAIIIQLIQDSRSFILSCFFSFYCKSIFNDTNFKWISSSTKIFKKKSNRLMIN